MENFKKYLKRIEAGECYGLGNGVEKSFEKAFEWYKKASYVKYESQFF